MQKSHCSKAWSLIIHYAMYLQYPPPYCTSTTSTNHLNKVGWSHAFMLFRSNITCMSQNRLIQQAMFFVLLGEGSVFCPVLKILCKFLVAPGVVFCCQSPFVSGLYVQRWSSAYFGYNMWLCYFILWCVSIVVGRLSWRSVKSKHYETARVYPKVNKISVKLTESWNAKLGRWFFLGVIC